MRRSLVTRVSDGLGNQLFQFALGENFSNLTGRRHVLDISHFFVQRWFGKRYCRRRYLLSHFSAPSHCEKLNLLAVCGMFVAWSWRTFVSVSAAEGILRWLGIAVIRPRNVVEWNPNYQRQVLGEKCRTLYFAACYGMVPLLPSRAELRRIFSFVDELSAEAKRFADRMASCESVSVHIRRSDYVGLNNVLPRSYYERAMKEVLGFTSAARFFFFSDDPAWCRREFADLPNVEFVDLPHAVDRPWEDLRLMSVCRHHIIANSTFSWWGAALSENERGMTIYPDPWFPGLRTTPESVFPDWLAVRSTDDGYC